MHTYLLAPTDILYFRDGRPMDGSLTGHGAAWPLPHIPHQAIHAALHRAFPEHIEGEHSHRPARSGKYSEVPNAPGRRFGELVTAGPFPVSPDGNWLFPRPADAQSGDTLAVTHFPGHTLAASSLPKPLQYPVFSTLPPSKESDAKPWITAAAYNEYISGNGATIHDKPTVEPAKAGTPTAEQASHKHFFKESDFFDAESQIGIAIDPETGTTGQGESKGQIYSANYLRLRDNWRLGLHADGQQARHDFLAQLFQEDHRIIVGGQQRICTVEHAVGVPALAGSGLNGSKTSSGSGSFPSTTHSSLLPIGLTEFPPSTDGKYRVKWVLLSPAIWPEIKATTSKLKDDSGRAIPGHPGGWLPNWIDPRTGAILLTHGIGKAKAERLKRHGRPVPESGPISARLVAAIVPKPLTITGWALGDYETPADDAIASGGAKATHLAVPAGAVYYFETLDADSASKLANALNWHGQNAGTAITNRRSTLWGEKGYGLGVCSSWSTLSRDDVK